MVGSRGTSVSSVVLVVVVTVPSLLVTTVVWTLLLQVSDKHARSHLVKL